MSLKLTWYGHSAFGLDIDGTNILIDPFLTNNPLAPVSADTLEASYIMLTHAHGDHLGDTVAIAQRTKATVIGNVEVTNWLGKQGIQNVHVLSLGDGFTFPFGQVTYVKAEHGSAFPDGTDGGQACGIILEAQDKRIYFAGDTALFPEMKLIGERKIDLACLPIGGHFTMGPDDALTAIDWIHPQVVFPIHYNTFPDIYQDVAAWARRVNNETSAQAIVVDPGSSFSV
jgi:L-ascorbate metabolism protein UlaG (beta-lactamase superfamily)